MKINKYHENEQIPSSGTHLVDEDYGRVKNSGSQKWEGDLRYMVIVLKKKKKEQSTHLEVMELLMERPRSATQAMALLPFLLCTG